MSDELILPFSRPDNMYAPGSAYVTSDVFNICNRIKELDPNLRIIVQDNFPDHPYTVVEVGRDKVERFVKRYKTLDASILADLQRMLRVPFEHRLQVLYDEVAAAEAEQAKMPEDKMEEMLFHMREAMTAGNMWSPKWSKSMPLKTKRYK